MRCPQMLGCKEARRRSEVRLAWGSNAPARHGSVDMTPLAQRWPTLPPWCDCDWPRFQPFAGVLNSAVLAHSGLVSNR